MKNFYIICLTVFIICLSSFTSKALIISVSVSDYVFSPANITINLGDTIIWTWFNSSGSQAATSSHTTTSTNIPVDAAPWDEPITSASPVFSYVPTILGSYNYICTPHFGMGMTGHFTVIGSAGIETSLSATLNLNSINPAAKELKLIYTIPKSMNLNIKMYNIMGTEMFTFISSAQNAGVHTETFAIPNLSDGIYIIALESKEAILYKKIFIQ